MDSLEKKIYWHYKQQYASIQILFVKNSLALFLAYLITEIKRDFPFFCVYKTYL